MKKVFIALTIAAACYACGGGDSKTTTPVSNNDSNANSSIGGADTASTATAPAPATTAPATAAAPAKDGKALIEASDCRTCHKDDGKLIGPSYADVAKKYESNEANIQKLAGKVMAGGTGVWGEIPMSPHPNIVKEDAEAMVKYILSLKK